MNDKDSMPCPHCHEPVARAASVCRHCDRGIDGKLFSPCSFCGEMVRKTATRCRFCQARLADPERKGQPEKEAPRFPMVTLDGLKEPPKPGDPAGLPNIFMENNPSTGKKQGKDHLNAKSYGA